MKNPKKLSVIVFLFVLMLVGLAANTVHAVQVIGTIPVNTAGPMAYDSGKNEIFVTNINTNHSASDSVSVISDTNNTVIATVTVGYGAYYLAYDSGRNEVFAATLNSIAVISDSNNSVVATVALPSYLNHASVDNLVYDAGKGEIFAITPGNTGSTVSVISDTTNAVLTTIPMGGAPVALAYDSR